MAEPPAGVRAPEGEGADERVTGARASGDGLPSPSADTVPVTVLSRDHDRGDGDHDTASHGSAALRPALDEPLDT